MAPAALLTIALSAGAAEPAATPEVIPCTETPTGMACVAGGWFVRGANDDRHECKQRFGDALRQRPNARPAAKVWLQTFFIDTHEVTFAEFATCIKAKACDLRPEDGGWGPRYTDFSRPRQSITGVNWFQSQQFCRWRNKALPTEAQWEKAARGADGELYPWGSAPASCSVAVIKDPQRGRSCGVKKKGSASTGRVLEVGSKPPGRYGLYDMIGNVEEWVADWYSDDYAACGDACLGIDPNGPCAGAEHCPDHRFKVVRGGSWYWDASHGTSIHRRPHYPDNRAPKHFHHFGFRCAADPEKARATRAGAVGAPAE